MLSDHEFQKYVAEHNLSDAAVSYISQVRLSEASRMAGVKAKRNICSWVVSEKMGRSISTESRTAEKGFVYLCEYDERVIEFWDQPEPVKINRTNKNGQMRPASYTPDFLLLTVDGPRLIEVKPEDKAQELSEKYPTDWIPSGLGGYDYIPATRAFDRLDLRHKVFIYSPHHRYRVTNIEMMLASRSEEGFDIDLMSELRKAFDESFFWLLRDLKERLNQDSYTALIQLIDQGLLYGDIDAGLLSDSEAFIVTMDTGLLTKAKEVSSAAKIYTDSVPEPLPIEAVPSETAAKEALERLERVNSGENGRSVRRWRKTIEEGKKQGLSPFQSLLPKTHLKGNRTRRINKVVDEFVNEYLLTVHAKSQGLSIYRSYIRYTNEAVEAHPLYDALSRKAFERRLKAIPASIIARGRGGNRAENAAAAPTDPVKRSLKPSLPWMAAAIDHYLTDVYVVIYSGGGVAYVERPWMTAMIDLCTSSIVAVTLSFKNPSKDLCSKIVRECVRLHGLLPREILLDRGSDFRSVYFASLLAHYGVTNSQRPSGDSRFGGEVEGFFGEFKKQWLTQRPGNLADYKEIRSVDGKLTPKNSAVLTAGQLYKELKDFCAWRDAKPKNNKLYSGADRFSQSEADFPFIGIPVKYDDEFILVTSVESHKYKVDFQRGIHVDEKFYWTSKLEKIRGKKSQVEVRRDPENPEIIFALIDGHWESCYGSEVNSFSSLDQTSQFEKGLIALEAVNYRRKIKQEMDKSLDRMRRSSDVAIEHSSIEVDVEIPVRPSLFDDSAYDDESLTVTGW